MPNGTLQRCQTHLKRQSKNDSLLAGEGEIWCVFCFEFHSRGHLCLQYAMFCDMKPVILLFSDSEPNKDDA